MGLFSLTRKTPAAGTVGELKAQSHIMDRTPQTTWPPSRGRVGLAPENLDVDALLESCGQRVGEGVLWLGHCVYTGLADDARCRDTGRVPLRAEYLRNVIGRHHLDAVREAALRSRLRGP